MTAGALAEPEDDAFIRTAIRGMQPPEHEESFWDRLAGDLDAVEDAAGGSRGLGAPGSLDDRPAPTRAHAPQHAPRHAPRRAPLRATDRVVIDAPTVAAPAAPAAAPPPVLAAPVAEAVPAMLVAAAKAPSPAAAPAPAPKVRRVDPLAGFKVRHDAATMPAAMRRTSNVVLLTVALAAILVAIIAGLSLVKSRSESGAPSPSETRSEAAPLPGGDLAGLPVQTR